jgi:hypothetical protein
LANEIYLHLEYGVTSAPTNISGQQKYRQRLVEHVAISHVVQPSSILVGFFLNELWLSPHGPAIVRPHNAAGKCVFSGQG